jgi:hypothetical protein
MLAHAAMLAVSLVWLGLGTHVTSAQPSEILSYSVPSVITLHEPVVLDIGLRNDLRDPVTADLGESCVSHLEFDLQKPDGSHAVAHPRGLSDPRQGSGLESVFHFDLEPGGTASCWVVLNQFLDFAVPGTYRLEIRFNGLVQTKGGSAVNLTRAITRDIRVLRRDEAALLRVCAALVRESRDALVDPRMRAVRALGYVDDPIAVPFLQEAAETDLVANVEIECLVRIGGPEARKALEALLLSSNSWTEAMARGALNRIK